MLETAFGVGLNAIRGPGDLPVKTISAVLIWCVDIIAIPTEEGASCARICVFDSRSFWRRRKTPTRASSRRLVASVDVADAGYQRANELAVTLILAAIESGS